MDLEKIMPDQKLLDAFHLMYDKFPEAVQLTHKSKTVVAVNPEMSKRRYVGMICATDGDKPHTGCLANKALKDQKSKWVYVPEFVEKRPMVTYWLPIDGYPDYYIHFAVGIKNYQIPDEETESKVETESKSE